MDRETTAQEKCFQILEEVLLSSIVPYSKLVAQLTVRTLKLFMQCEKFLLTLFTVCNAKTFANVRSSHSVLTKKVYKMRCYGLSVHIVTVH